MPIEPWLRIPMIYSEAFDAGPSLRVVIAVPTRGCRWVRSGSPCQHCPVPGIMATHGAVTRVVSAVKEEATKYSRRRVETVCLYSPGSLLDASEMSEGELEEVVRTVTLDLNPKRIIIEARPELIDKNVLAVLQHLIKLANIEVNIPLESWNQKTRVALGKSFSNRLFSRAARDVQQIGCDFSSSVLLKPPSLSEGDAISDAVDTIEWLSRLDPLHVVLEPMHVFSGTPLAAQYLAGEYAPPWWWSAAEVFFRADSAALRLGGEFLYPKPLAYPRGCNACSPAIRRLFRETPFRAARDGCRAISCGCWEHWRDEISD